MNPKNKFFQIEIYHKNGKITGTLHKSMGHVVTDKKSFTKEKISKIIENLIKSGKEIFDVNI